MESVIVFNFQIQQMSVKYSNHKENLFQFLINLCAILGGVFTLMGIIDGAFYQASKVIFKEKIGKQK
jgi:hypothetical protein